MIDFDKTPPALAAGRNRPPALDGLTGLRGVAAMSVMFGHYFVNTGASHHTFLIPKDAAVDIFFVLSSFTLLHVYHLTPSFPWTKYVLARCGRIYPLYLLSCVAMFAVCVDFYGSEPYKLMTDSAEQLLLLSNWPLLGEGTDWNIVGWSLSVEWLMYFAVFPIIYAVRAFAVRLNPGLMAIVALLTMMLSYIVYQHAWNFAVIGISFGAKDPVSLLIPALRGLLGFMAGSLTYFFYLRIRDRKTHTFKNVVDVICIVAVALTIILSENALVPPQSIIVLSPILVLCAASDSILSRHVLRRPALVYLGEISYGVYLIHMPLLFGFQSMVDAIDGKVSAGATILVSYPITSTIMMSAATILLATLSRWSYEPWAAKTVRNIGQRRAQLRQSRS